MTILHGLLPVSLDLILIGIEDFYGMNCLDYLVGGHGALGEILMLLIFLARDGRCPFVSSYDEILIFHL